MSSLNDSVLIVNYRCANCDRESDCIAADKKCAECKSDLIEESGKPLDAKLEKSAENCSICLEAMDDKWHRLLCGHGFHEKCISSWLTSMATCPLCRKFVKSPLKSRNAVSHTHFSGAFVGPTHRNPRRLLRMAAIRIQRYERQTTLVTVSNRRNTSGASETRVEPNN